MEPSEKTSKEPVQTTPELEISFVENGKKVTGINPTVRPNSKTQQKHLQNLRQDGLIQMQRQFGNQAVLRLLSKRRANVDVDAQTGKPPEVNGQKVEPSQSPTLVKTNLNPPGSSQTVQRVLGYKDAIYFRANHIKHLVIQGWAVDMGNDYQHAENIYNLGVLSAAPTQDDLKGLIKAGGGGAADFGKLSALVTAVNSRGSVAEISGLLDQVANSGLMTELTKLVEAVNQSEQLTDLTNLLKTLGKHGSLNEATSLIEEVGNNGKLGDITSLLQVSLVKYKFAQLISLVKAVGKKGTLAAVEILIKTLNKTATLPELETLVKAMRENDTLTGLGTLIKTVGDTGTLEAIKSLIEAVGGNGTLEENAALVKEAGKNGSLADIVALVKGASLTGPVSELTDLVKIVGDKGTLLQMVDLFKETGSQGTLKELGLLLKASKAGEKLSEIISLVKATGEKGTIPELTALVSSTADRGKVAEIKKMITASSIKNSIEQLTSLFNEHNTLTSSEGVLLMESLPALNVEMLRSTLKPLMPGLVNQEVIDLIKPLLADGLSPQELTELLNKLKKQGKGGKAIQTMVRNMRGNLIEPSDKPDAPADARSNLTVSPAGESGTQVLNGKQIKNLVDTNSPKNKEATPDYTKIMPNGQKYTEALAEMLWSFLNRTAMNKLPVSPAIENQLEVASRQALILAALKKKADLSVVQTVWELYDIQPYKAFNFTIGELRGLVDRWIKELSAAEIKEMLDPLQGITGSQVINLLKALQDGMDLKQIKGLLKQLKEKGALNGQAIYDLVIKLRGNLTVHTGQGAPAQATKSILTPLSPLAANKKDPDSAGKRILNSGEILSHVSGRLGQLGNLEVAPDLGKVYPTGQDYTAFAVDTLWLDCSDVPRYNDLKSGIGETKAQGEMRRKLALNQLKSIPGNVPELVQAVFNYNSGQAHRPFDSAATEDGYNFSGHTVDSHVLNGNGQIGTLAQLANRVVTKVPKCGVWATAFNTLVEANNAISQINGDMTNQWPTYRTNIVTNHLEEYHFNNITGVKFEKNDAPKGSPYSQADINGGRPLFGPVAAPVVGQPPLVFSVAPTKVRVSIDAKAEAPGGWYLVTGFPE